LTMRIEASYEPSVKANAATGLFAGEFR
jgi:hypothetical protein